MSLATQDDGGLWVSDLIFIHNDDLNIFWLSNPQCRHSKAILENPNVAGTVTVSNKTGEQNFGIQFEGLAEKIEGARYDLSVKHLFKRGYPVPEITDDVLGQNSWYVLKPSKIRLIDEALSGYMAQDVSLENFL